jgi:hypothetical protein
MAAAEHEHLLVAEAPEVGGVVSGVPLLRKRLVRSPGWTRRELDYEE